MYLLTYSNPKTRKGERYGYLTAVLHLTPGRKVCPQQTPGCAAACLYGSGCGVFASVQAARARRTQLWLEDRRAFVALVERDVEDAARTAVQRRLTLAVRLNATSDIIQLPYQLSARYPEIQFYDYTKNLRPWMATRDRPNYHLTFSRSERNETQCRLALEQGINVAVVFGVKKGAPLPKRYYDRRVIDGDLHDLRFLDPPRVVVGLRAKGPAIKDQSGFVVQPTSG